MAKKITQVDIIGLNVERFAGCDAMEKVMEGREELKPNVGDEELALWVNGAMGRMDTLLPKETRNAVMDACGKNCIEANRRAINAGLTKRKKAKTEEVLINAEVKAVKASSRLERGDGVLYQVYTPCGFGKGSAASAPSRGGSQRGRSCRQHTVSAGKPSRVSTGSVLGRPVDVKLLESGLTGSDVCRFEIRL